MIKNFKDILFAEKWVQDKYFVSDNTMLSFYGVIILSKYPCKFYEHLFPISRMGRSIVFCETLINGEPILVSTVHLESLENPEVRINQMNLSFPILKHFNNSFIMGDFNFHSTWPEQKVIDENNFDDVFLTLNSGKEALTFPSEGVRLDKIVCNKTGKWKGEQIYIIGGFSIPSFSKEDPNKNV